MAARRHFFKKLASNSIFSLPHIYALPHFYALPINDWQFAMLFVRFRQQNRDKLSCQSINGRLPCVFVHFRQQNRDKLRCQIFLTKQRQIGDI
jgi:hypothetical protein